MIPLNYRKQGELKKAYYRRLAQIRKAKWLSCLKHQDETFKSHFMAKTQDEEDTLKTKKICKNEPKSQQKIRNRMAAQQSRQRHRIYVQELQRKVRTYEQLIQKQGLLCKNCRKDLVSDTTQSQEAAKLQQENEKIGENLVKKEAQWYLQQQIIRIDNEGVATPYGIFFVICIIAVIGIFAFTSNVADATDTNHTRILTNYNSNQQIQQQIKKQAKIEDLPNFLDLIKSKNNALSNKKCTHTERTPIKKNLQSYTPSLIQGWTKFGKYICSQPQVLMNECQVNKPQFILVHTERNRTQQVKDTQNENYKIQSKDWQRVEISQCFLGAL